MRSKDVPSHADSLDDRGISGIGLDLLPDAADVDIDAALLRTGKADMSEGKELGAAEDPARILAEREQHIEFG